MENTSLTPAVLTAMIGLSSNLALAPVANNTIATTYLGNIATCNVALHPTWFSNAQIAHARDITYPALTSLTANLFASSSGGFVQILARVQGHVKKSAELVSTNSTMAGTEFTNLGSGVTSVSSMTDQGLTATFGNVKAVGAVMNSMGSMFTLTDPTSIGTAGGFAEILINNQLANQIGLTSALQLHGVDVEDIRNPIYESRILQVMATIVDLTQLEKVAVKLQLTPYKKILNLAEYLDISKMNAPLALTGLTANLSIIRQKFTDLNASFPSQSVAVTMLNSITIAPTTALDSATPSLSNMIAGFSNTTSSMTGIGTGPNNLPTVNDFVHVVAGGSALSAVAANANVSVQTMQLLDNAILMSTKLFGNAGISFEYAPTVSSETVMGFVQGLHDIGADSSLANISATLTSMATSDKYGEAIKASMVEGRNISAFATCGIKPLRF